MDKRMQELAKLYNSKSRHSQYQILASSLENLVQYNYPVKSKYEKERWDYISSNVDLNDKNILDIGGNTGFFTFESFVKQSPKKMDYYEGNKEHAKFVSVAAEVLNLEKKIKVHPEYFLFDDVKKIWDVTYFLNVIHHIGFDFEKNVDSAVVKDKMLIHINSMAKCSRIMVFQMGFNWYGNVQKCLFDNGAKKEMENYIIDGTENYWEIVKIGIAERMADGTYTYCDVNENNNHRVDEYGEFLNRPIFIMQSKLV